MQSIYLHILLEMDSFDIIPYPIYCTVTIILGLQLGAGRIFLKDPDYIKRKANFGALGVFLVLSMYEIE